MLHKFQKACNFKFNIHYDNPSELIEMYVHFNGLNNRSGHNSYSSLLPAEQITQVNAFNFIFILNVLSHSVTSHIHHLQLLWVSRWRRQEVRNCK